EAQRNENDRAVRKQVEPRNGVVPRMSQRDLGGWMSHRLRVDGPHNDETRELREERGQRVKLMPQFKLEDVEQRKHLCLSTDTRIGGARADVGKVMEMPQFDQLFSVFEPDNRFKIYALRPGETIEGFRQEAVADPMPAAP